MVSVADLHIALHGIYRFTGHAQGYSVAAHCINGVEYMLRYWEPNEESKSLALDFLLHDAHEAYTWDISSPMKSIIGRERIAEIEDRIQDCIRARLRLPPISEKNAELVKALDQSLMVAEHNRFLPNAPPLTHMFGTDEPPIFNIDLDDLTCSALTDYANFKTCLFALWPTVMTQLGVSVTDEELQAVGFDFLQ